MRRLTICLLLISTACLGQTLSPTEKATLDFYYARKITNTIDGAWLIDRTVTGDKLQTNTISGIHLKDDSISNRHVGAGAGIDPAKILNTALTQATTFGGDVTGLYNDLSVTNVWRVSTNVPSSSTDAAIPETIAVESTNVWICLTNDWQGPGTNWLRLASGGGGGAGAAAVRTYTNLQSSIYGCWPEWVSTTAVDITPGEGYCYSNYFTVATNCPHTITNAPAGEGLVYVYLSSGQSTFPSDLVFYDEAQHPTTNDALHGYYHPVNVQDRVIGALWSGPGATTISNFWREPEPFNGYMTAVLYATTYMKVLGSAINPDWTWQAMDDAEASTVLPSNASWIYVRCQFGASAPTLFCVAAKEHADKAPYKQGPGSSWWTTANLGTQYRLAWIQLGYSKEIRAVGENDDGNYNIQWMGWRELR